MAGKKKGKKSGMSVVPDVPKAVRAGEIKKIKVKKVEFPDPETTRVELELDVKGAPTPPALVTPETPVEIDPVDVPEEQTGWIAWLKSIW